MMRYSCALALLLALSFALSSEGVRLRREGGHDVAANSHPDIDDTDIDDEAASLISTSVEGAKGRRRRSRRSGGQKFDEECPGVDSSTAKKFAEKPRTTPKGKQHRDKTPGCCKCNRNSQKCMACGAGGFGQCHRSKKDCESKICDGVWKANGKQPQCR
jgi:hypothetical protein